MGRILIVGCGRSGTKYVAEMFRLAGLDVGHEKDGADGSVDWHKAVLEPKDLSAYDVVLHQVRSPLPTIASMHTAGGISWDYICEHEPRIGRNDPLMLRCMKYWLFWNERAQAVAAWTYRVESLPKVFPKILSAFGAKVPGHKSAAKIAALSPKTHSRKEKPSYGSITTWESLLREDTFVAEAVISLAKSYGYRMEVEI